MLHDDLRRGIDTLDGADKLNGFASVTFRIARVADDERELGNDAKVLQAPGHGESLLGGDSLFHLLESSIRPRFGAEKDHGASRLANQFKSAVGVAADGVDAALAPPVQIERSKSLHQLGCM